MTKIRNSSVLITGAANGIGKLLALRCLQEGAHKVILWDINEANLEKTLAEFSTKGFDNTAAYLVDVSDLDDIKSSAADVLKNHGTVDVLFNNAGIVVGKTFVEHTHRDIAKTIDINVSGVMHTALCFLPSMILQEHGHIINIASAAGLVPNPSMSVYAASKWAVIGWSESLRLEMEAEHKGVKITTIEPSYINTGMFDGVTAPLLSPIMEPAFIVEKIMEGVAADAILVREPFIVNAVPLLRGILPTRAFDFVAEKLGVYHSMDHFQGRPAEEAVPEKKNLEKNKVHK